jgi:hypothetical protein
MFSRSGKFMSDRQRKAMFSKLGLYEDDPKEARISDRLASILGEKESTIKYHKPEVVILGKSVKGGRNVHIFTKDLPPTVLQYDGGNISYTLDSDVLMGLKKQPNQYTSGFLDRDEDEDLREMDEFHKR